DRRVWVLRREQIRNTGMRFKFQMLVQRLNTFQQYWQRVAREIENGTYRRDVIRAAQRFGEKDALTLFGKKRADQYKRLLEAQQERLGRKKPLDEELETALGDEDVELVEDSPAALRRSGLSSHPPAKTSPLRPSDLPVIEGARLPSSRPPAKP